MAVFAVIPFICVSHISDSQLCPVIFHIRFGLTYSSIGWRCHRLRHQRHCHPHVIPSARGKTHHGLACAVHSRHHSQRERTDSWGCGYGDQRQYKMIRSRRSYHGRKSLQSLAKPLRSPRLKFTKQTVSPLLCVLCGFARKYLWKAMSSVRTINAARILTESILPHLPSSKSKTIRTNNLQI